MDEVTSGNKPIIEGLVKFRDGKKWKSRWCTLKKLSPVADYIHFQLYREKDYRKGNLPKASLALSDYVGCESGFTLDKESHTLAMLCKNGSSVIIAFSGPEELLQWKTRATRVLHTGQHWRWPGHLIASGQNSGIKPTAISVHMRTSDFCIVSGLPPKILAVWRLEDLRKYGIVNGLVCFEGGSNCGKMSGKWVLKIDKPENFMNNLERIKYSVERGLATTSFEKQLPDISSLPSDVFQSRNDVNDEWIGHNEKNKDFFRKKDQSEKTLKYSSFINKWGPLVSPSFSQCTADSFTETERSTDMDRMSLFSQSSMLSDDTTCKSYFTGDDNLTSNRFHYNLNRNCYPYHSNKQASVYGNYDVPKSPSTIFQVHNKSNVNSLYDKPNKISRCLITNSTNCNCYQKILTDGKTSFITFKAQPNNTQNNPSINDQSNSKSVSDNNTLLEDTTDIYADLKLFESSEAILRNAGFSEEEIKNIDDSNISSAASEEAKLPRTINSTETIEKEEKIQEYNKSYSENISLNLKPLGETCTTVCTQVCSKCSDNNAVKKNCNNELDKASDQCVKIRRSSSVPNKCLKNRESCSSSDSGISTGSLKPNHSRVLKENHFQLNSQFSARMHLPAVKSQGKSDQIDNITFRFDKMHERDNLCLTRMIASDFVCETDFKSLRILSLPELIPDLSHMNSLEFSENSTRCTSRPRSGKEYLVLHPV